MVALSGGFAELAALSAVARLLFSATTCLAVPLLRRQQAARGAGFTLPGGPAVPLVAVGLSVWLLTGVTRTQAIAGGLGLASALAVYGLQRWLGGRRSATA